MSKIIESTYEEMVKLLFQENVIIRKSVSWFLLQVTEYFPKIFTKESLKTFISSIIKCLNDTNYIAINICFTLVNLIKHNGDLQTTKNTSIFFDKYLRLFFSSL